MSVPRLYQLEYKLASRLSLLDSQWTCSACRRRGNKKLSGPRAYSQSSSRRSTGAVSSSQTSPPPDRELTSAAGHARSGTTTYLDTSETRRHLDHQFKRPFQLSISPSSSQGYKVDDQYGVLSALLQKDADRLLTALLDASSNADFLRQLPRTTWSECLQLLTSNPPGLSYHFVHRAWNPRRLRQVGASPRTQRTKLNRILATIIDLQREAGIKNTITDYRILLGNVAAWGHMPAAQTLWADMKANGVEPDLSCYNHYMQAILYNEEDRLQLTKKALDTVPATVNKATDITLFDSQNLPRLSELFTEMESYSVKGDLVTYSHLITALGREGDIAQVCAILERAWGIQIEALLKDESMAAPKIMHQPTSPLYPRQPLLMAIVDAFGQNNRIPAALRAVEYVSHYYQIPIKANVWYNILKWTWMQSRIKSKGRVKSGEHQMTLDTVARLFETMQSPPYSVKPSMDMYDLMFQTEKGLSGTKYGAIRPWRLVDFMEIGHEHLVQARESSYYHSYHEENRSSPAGDTRGVEYSSSPSAIQQQRLNQAKTQISRHRWFLRKWARTILETAVAWPHPQDVQARQELRDWQLRGLPNFLLKYRAFSPPSVKYRLDRAGVVELMV